MLRDDKGHVVEIVEVAEARLRDDTDAILAVRELNAGVYCFDAEWLWQNLPNIPLRQARSGPEYYLTDAVGMAVAQGRVVEAVVAEDADECLGAGTREELAVVEAALRRRTNRRWLDAGVTLVDPQSTYIDVDAVIGQDTVIWPNSYIQGKTVIGEDCTIGPDAILRNARLGARCHVAKAVLDGVTLDDGTCVEPFTCLSG